MTCAHCRSPELPRAKNQRTSTHTPYPPPLSLSFALQKGAIALPHRTSQRAQYPRARPSDPWGLYLCRCGGLNDSERLAKIAKISKIAKTSGRTTKPVMQRRTLKV